MNDGKFCFVALDKSGGDGLTGNVGNMEQRIVAVSFRRQCEGFGCCVDDL